MAPRNVAAASAQRVRSQSAGSRLALQNCELEVSYWDRGQRWNRRDFPNAGGMRGCLRFMKETNEPQRVGCVQEGTSR